jgi:hypothetical protein
VTSILYHMLYDEEWRMLTCADVCRRMPTYALPFIFLSEVAYIVVLEVD